MVIGNKDLEVLQSVRRIYEDLLKLREEIKEQKVIALHSPSMDGLPRGSGHADMMAAYMIRLDNLERKEKDLMQKMSAARLRVYQVCRRMKSLKATLFFEAYCADLQSVETASKISGADDQMVRQYLKALKEDK